MAKVVFDNTVLTLLWRANAAPPVNPENGKPVTDYRERLEFLIQELEAQGTKVLIPTPALMELLVGYQDVGQKVLDDIGSSSVYEIKAFGTRAAVEAALAVQIAKSMGRLKGLTDSHWQKVKVDRQIVAIAVVERAALIYSDDADVKNIADDCGLKCVSIAELPKPPVNPQMPLDLQDEVTNEQSEPQPKESEPEAPGVQRSGDGSTDGAAAAQEPKNTHGKSNGEAKGEKHSEGQKVVEAGAVEQKTKPDTNDNAKANPQG